MDESVSAPTYLAFRRDFFWVCLLVRSEVDFDVASADTEAEIVIVSSIERQSFVFMYKDCRGSPEKVFICDTFRDEIGLILA